MRHWSTDGRIESDRRYPWWARTAWAFPFTPRWLLTLAARRLGLGK